MNIAKRILKSGGISYKADLWRGGKFIRSKTFKKKCLAEKWLASERNKDMGEFSEAKSGLQISLQDFFQNHFFRISNIRPSTKKTYTDSLELHVFPYFGHKKIAKINRNDIRFWLEDMGRRELTNATINRVRTAFSALFRAALDEQMIFSNPFQGIRWAKENPIERGYWTREELTKILLAAHSFEKQIFTFFLMAFETGLRISELRGLTWDCVNLADLTITVKQVWCSKEDLLRKSTKNNHIRTIPISPLVRQNLMAMSNSRKGLIFGSGDRPIGYGLVRSRLAKLVKDAKVRKLSFHSFRHTYASHFLFATEDLKSLRDLLGHQDFETTLRYSHMCLSKLHEKGRKVQFEFPKQDVLEISQAFPKPLERKQLFSEEKIE